MTLKPLHFLFAFVIPFLAFGQKGYEIKVRVDGIKDTTAFLGYHYGDKQYVTDTVRVDGKGNFVFKGDEPLDGGIYLIVLLNKSYFEIIVSEQKFSLETDTLDLVNHLKVSGSKENLIFNSLITDQQKIEMGLNVSSGSHTPRPAIKTVPNVSLKPLSGGAVAVECRVEGDSSRPSIHPDADIVEVRFKIGEPAPNNVRETNEIYNSTKGSFTLKLGQESVLKPLFVFARWVNSSDNSKSGMWSSISTVAIS